jgi:hypothetical protein
MNNEKAKIYLDNMESTKYIYKHSLETLLKELGYVEPQPRQPIEGFYITDEPKFKCILRLYLRNGKWVYDIIGRNEEKGIYLCDFTWKVIDDTTIQVAYETWTLIRKF